MATQVSLNSGAVASAGALALQTNGTTQAVSISTGQVATLAQNPILTSGTINGVAYLNGSNALTTGSALTFDGSGAFKSSGTTNGFLSSGTFVNSSNGASAVNRVQIGNDASDGSGQIVVYGSQHSTLSNVMDINNAQNAALRFLTNNTEGLRLTSTSLYTASTINVGIGTSSPAYKLDVLGSTGSSVIASFRSGETTTTQRAGAGFQTIGSATAASRSARLFLDADGGDFAGSDYFYIDKVGSSGEVAFIQQSNAAMTFHTNATKQMTIDSSGNLLVGTTVMPSSSFAGMGYNRGSTFLSLSCGATTTSVPQLYFTNGNGTVGSISTSGSATAYNTSSDYRLKNITGPLTGAKDFIMALKPKQGTWKVDGSAFVGFLAHEFQEVSPSSVSGVKDAVDEDGNPIMQGMQASSSEVMANLIALVQEQQFIITQLTARITALEGA